MWFTDMFFGQHLFFDKKSFQQNDGSWPSNQKSIVYIMTAIL